MKYPYFLMSADVKIRRIIKDQSEPFLIILDDDMCKKAMSLSGDSERINQWFADMIKDSGHSWAVGAYLENRESILSQYEHMASGRRYFHLGIDICIPAGTPIFAPLDGVVEEVGYESGEGNYGGYVVLKHSFEGVEPFYVMFGHMSVDSLPAVGTVIKSGDEVAKIGDIHENGGWNHHTHVQIITERGRAEGFFFKGYCSEKDLKNIEELCPNPMPLLTAGL